VTIRVEAIYDNGVLRPVEPIPVDDQARVTLTLEAPAQIVPERASPRRARRSIEEIQARWQDVPGSFADLILEERGES
jgi:predicted DNA-binding antitoxin AbrB/MazE fold protein